MERLSSYHHGVLVGTLISVWRRLGRMVGKAGLDVDPRFYCGMEKAVFGSSEHPSRMFGMDVSLELEENGCSKRFRIVH